MIRITFEFEGAAAAMTFLQEVTGVARPAGKPASTEVYANPPAPTGMPDFTQTPPAVLDESPKPRRGRPRKTIGDAGAVPPAVTLVGTPAQQEAPALPTPIPAAAKEPNAPVKAVAEAPAPKVQTSAPPPPPPPAATQDTVRAALREVFNTKGAKVATDILKQFGAARISDVKPEQYAAFLKACS